MVRFLCIRAASERSLSSSATMSSSPTMLPGWPFSACSSSAARLRSLTCSCAASPLVGQRGLGGLQRALQLARSRLCFGERARTGPLLCERVLGVVERPLQHLELLARFGLALLERALRPLLLALRGRQLGARL